MTVPTPLPRLLRRIAATGRALALTERAAAIVEMALVLPLLVALAMGILVYGQYFMLAHSVQQAANDGARAAIVGLDPPDRSAIAERAVDRSMAAVKGYSAEARSIAVSESEEAVTVAVAFTVPDDAYFLSSSLVPSPSRILRANATFELPVD